jgi:hypothetical protein
LLSLWGKSQEVNADKKKTKYMVMSRDQNAGLSHSIKTDNLLGRCGTVQTFGNNLNESILLRKKLRAVEVRECLISFGAESFVFQFAIQKYKDEDTQNYNFACCFV